MKLTDIQLLTLKSLVDKELISCEESLACKGMYATYYDRWEQERRKLADLKLALSSFLPKY